VESSSTLPAGFPAARLTAAFTRSTAARTPAAAVLAIAAASMWFSARTASTAVACLFLLFFGDHNSSAKAETR
jgi:hypothetical protein